MQGKGMRFLKKAWRPAGLVIAPLVFAAVLLLAGLAVVGLSLDDIRSYGNLLLFDGNRSEYRMEEFLAPELYAHEEVRDEIPFSQITFPQYGDAYGEIIIESADIHCPLVYGDSEALLRIGAGQTLFSRIIGYPGTTLVCAHVNRQFANLHKVQEGDIIQVNTTYGRYTYQVTRAFVADADDPDAFDLEREDENLVLYTCYYQQTAFGSVKRRYFVNADYLSGPIIV